MKLKCETLHIGKLLRRYPRDPYIRGKFVIRKKQYKQACRAAKRIYVNNIAHQLDSLQVKNPKEFWSRAMMHLITFALRMDSKTKPLLAGLPDRKSAAACRRHDEIL